MSKRQAALFFVGVTSVFLLVFLGLTVHSHTRFGALTKSDRIDASVERGKDVWHQGNCVNCHTLLGEGAYYAPDLTRITAQRGTAYLTAFLQNPGRFYSEAEHRRLMTAPNLSESEIRDLLAFLGWIDGIDNLNWPPRPIQVTGSPPGMPGHQPEVAHATDDPVAQGEALFRSAPASCYACHSTSPGGNMAGPSLAGIGTRAAQLPGSAGYAGSATDAAGYLRESIVQPSAHLVPGALYSADGRSFMPDNFERTLTAGQVEQLVAYLMTLR